MFVAHHTALIMYTRDSCVVLNAVASSTRRGESIAGGADVVHAGDLHLVRILSLSEQISNMMALELS